MSVDWSWYDPKSKYCDKGKYRRYGNVFGLEEVLEELYKDPKLKDVPKIRIIHLVYLEFFMFRQILKAQWWFCIMLPRIGKFFLSNKYFRYLNIGDIHYHLRRDKKWINDKFEDPFLKYPKEAYEDLLKRDIDIEDKELMTGRRRKQLFKRYYELGQRHYVLDRKPTA